MEAEAQSTVIEASSRDISFPAQASSVITLERLRILDGFDIPDEPPLEPAEQACCACRCCRTIHPGLRWRIQWDLAVMLCVMISVILVPYIVAFQSSSGLDGMYVYFFCVSVVFITNRMRSFYLDLILDAIFITDTCMNFVFGYTDRDGFVVMNGKQIARNYLSGFFWIDAGSVLPIDYIILAIYGPNSHKFTSSRIPLILRLARLVRLARLPKLMRYFSRYEARLGLTWIQLRLVKTVFILILIIHWFSCFHYLVASLAGFAPNTWPALNGIVHTHHYVQYTYSVFAVLSMMLGCGWGSYPIGGPNKLSEQWLMFVIMIFGACIWAVLAATFAAMVMNTSRSNVVFLQKWEEVQSYMRHRRLPTEMRNRVRAFLKHKYLGSPDTDTACVDDLPRSIRRDIAVHNVRDVIERCGVFKETSEGFTGALAPLLKPMSIVAREAVVTESEVASNVYFLISGSVTLYRQGKEMCVLNNGSFFGEVPILWPVKEPMTVVSSCDSQLYIISKDDFLSVSTLYPETERTIRRLSLLRLRDLDLLSALPSDTVATKCVLGPETSKDSPEYVVMYGDTRYDEADKEAAAEPPATVVLNGRTVIHPESKRRFYWDLFIVCACITSMTTTAFSAGFRLRYPLDDIFYLNIVLDAVFWFDMAVTLRTAVLDSDGTTLVGLRRAIWRQYSSFPFGGFWPDLIALLPMEYFALCFHDPSSASWSDSSVVVACRLLSLIRLFRVFRMLRYSGRIETRLSMRWISMHVLKSAILLLLFIHTMACVLTFQAELMDFNPGTWYYLNNLFGESEFYVYTRALLAIISTVTTNAYGDYSYSHITVISEMWTLIITMFFGVMGWLATTGAFCVFILDSNPNGQAYIRRLNEINLYMRQHHLPAPVCDQVRAYFNRRYKVNQIFDEESILESFPDSIRLDITKFTANAVLTHVPLFRDGHPGFVAEALRLLRHEFVCAKQFPILVHEPPSLVYFIGSGVVLVLDKTSEVARLRAGDYFGELAVMSHKKQRFSYYTAEDSDFYTIEGSAFNTLLEDWPDAQSLVSKEADERSSLWGALRTEPVPVLSPVSVQVKPARGSVIIEYV